MTQDLLQLLRQALADPAAKFHEGQEEAIRAVILPPHRILLVQATGWGKSMVYFLATKVLRDSGRGPTLVVSPLLSLMRNQVSAAQNLGLVAEHYTSANPADWKTIQGGLVRDEIDLLLISPERLADEEFRRFIEASSLARVGLVVIDEAHCISEWGHDFRPDYQRLGRLVRSLPSSTSVLATTATANDRVVEDILQQVGENVRLIRGSLARKSLKLQVIQGLNAAERLAWISDNITDLPGSGIIYTLTVRDADRVARWLQSHGHRVEAYHSKLSSVPQECTRLRVERESMLLNNEVKALVATVALGMGFDKPDLGFVIHYQSPGNLVAYYQQIGRAGRAIESATAVLLSGSEDDEIHAFFIENAAPGGAQVNAVLEALGGVDDGLSVPEITRLVDLRNSDVERVLKYLSVRDPSPVVKVGTKWRRAAVAFSYDDELERDLIKTRMEERERFKKFLSGRECFMMQVRAELNDPRAEPCGQCSNCVGSSLVPIDYLADTLKAAQRFLNESEFSIEPRKRWESGALPSYGFSGRITPDVQCQVGLCLSQYGDPGIGTWAREDKEAGQFRDELVEAAVLALGRAGALDQVEWVTAVPSHRSDAVADFAARLAKRLSLRFIEAVEKVRVTAPQKQGRNSYHQSRNLDGAFKVRGVLPGVALLVDDMVDSRWTFTVIGALLRRAGVRGVVPFALASTAARRDDE